MYLSEKIPYLHIGNGRLLKKADIVGIFDCDSATVAADSREYLAKMQRSDAVVSTTEEVPRAFVLECNPAAAGRRGNTEGRGVVYLSQISPGAPAKR